MPVLQLLALVLHLGPPARRQDDARLEPTVLDVGRRLEEAFVRDLPARLIGQFLDAGRRQQRAHVVPAGSLVVLQLLLRQNGVQMGVGLDAGGDEAPFRQAEPHPGRGLGPQGFEGVEELGARAKVPQALAEDGGRVRVLLAGRLAATGKVGIDGRVEVGIDARSESRALQGGLGVAYGHRSAIFARSF
jgi:hypothetical protein